MNPRIVKVVAASLGVPGFALLVFYLLMHGLGFTFAQISATWAGVIALVFVGMIGAVTIFALRLWSPRNVAQEPKDTGEQIESKPAQKIEVGSSVRILKVASGQLKSDEGVVEWKKGMSAYCGREATVTSVGNEEGPPVVKLDVDAGKNWWSIEWLTPITKRTSR